MAPGQPLGLGLNPYLSRYVPPRMRHVAAFFLRCLHLLRETFSDDATGKLSWQAFIGCYLSYELSLYLRRTVTLTDVCFVALIALLALLLYGPSKNLENFYKGLYGGFRTPDTQNNVQNNLGPADATQNVVPPIPDINSDIADPTTPR